MASAERWAGASLLTAGAHSPQQGRDASRLGCHREPQHQARPHRPPATGSTCAVCPGQSCRASHRSEPEWGRGWEVGSQPQPGCGSALLAVKGYLGWAGGGLTLTSDTHSPGLLPTPSALSTWVQGTPSLQTGVWGDLRIKWLSRTHRPGSRHGTPCGCPRDSSPGIPDPRPFTQERPHYSSGNCQETPMSPGLI